MSRKIDLQYHIVFATKERRPFFTDPEAKTLIQDIFQRIAQEQKIKIRAIAVQPEHVHMLISTSPDFTLKNFMQSIKGKSSYLIKKELPIMKDLAQRGLWSETYFARTTGHVLCTKIQDYILKQK
ncbi:MAG: IS200/IS605 family transposase [Elusimicrobiota bacterium]|nr:IS200/IS605 family transposase [Elusimicrobiota bacterium]